MFVRDQNLKIKMNQEMDDRSLYNGQINIKSGELEGYGV